MLNRRKCSKSITAIQIIIIARFRIVSVGSYNELILSNMQFFILYSEQWINYQELNDLRTRGNELIKFSHVSELLMSNLYSNKENKLPVIELMWASYAYFRAGRMTLHHYRLLCVKPAVVCEISPWSAD